MFGGGGVGGGHATAGCRSRVGLFGGAGGGTGLPGIPYRGKFLIRGNPL